MNRIKEILEEKGIKQIWLADKMEKSYNMINSYVQNRRQPSLEVLFKIASILDISVKELIDTNISDNDYNKPLAPILVNEEESDYEKVIKIPLIGSVSCGLPIFAEENIEARVPISIKLIKKGNKYFLLRAKGDSMNETGINDGDLVLIRQQQHAENRDRVVALIDDEVTIKEYHHNGNLVVLKPRSTNKKYQPIILSDEFRIQGIVESVIKF